MIEFQGVYKSYGTDSHALEDVNLHIDDGEFVFVLGASGAGKSTFLKLIMREEVPSSGEVVVDKYYLSRLKRKEIPYYRRTMGVVFQDFRLIEKKTVYENLAFVMRAVGAKEKDIRERVPYVLDLVGLSAKANSYPTEMSGGEQQRVAIARAFVNNPSTIIADEPTGNLDPERSMELMDLLVQINALGVTVMVVTHEKDLVDHFGKRVVTIENGQVVNDSVGGYVGGQIHA